MEFDYTELDRQLAHALQLDGRASFSAVADVLGVSDKTVARRYTRLRSAGVLRVVGATGVQPADVLWFLRVRCAPNTAVSIAEALARRPDTNWVSITAAGTEVVCSVHARSEADSEALLLAKLPRTPRVEGVTAHSVLHRFFGGPGSMIAKHGPLTEDQAARLRPAPPVRRPVALDEADQRLIDVLATDGRAGLAQLAGATGWSQTTARRRLLELRERGALYFDIDYDWRMFGLTARTLLWLSVEPARLTEVGAAMAAHPEVAFVGATTGPVNLCASVVSPNQRALYEYLTGPLAALPGLARIETASVLRTLKRVAPYPFGS